MKYSLEKLIAFIEEEKIWNEEVLETLDYPDSEADRKYLCDTIEKYKAIAEELYRLKDLED